MSNQAWNLTSTKKFLMNQFVQQNNNLTVVCYFFSDSQITNNQCVKIFDKASVSNSVILQQSCVLLLLLSLFFF